MAPRILTFGPMMAGISPLIAAAPTPHGQLAAAPATHGRLAAAARRLAAAARQLAAAAPRGRRATAAPHGRRTTASAHGRWADCRWPLFLLPALLLRHEMRHVHDHSAPAMPHLVQWPLNLGQEMRHGGISEGELLQPEDLQYAAAAAATTTTPDLRGHLLLFDLPLLAPAEQPVLDLLRRLHGLAAEQDHVRCDGQDKGPVHQDRVLHSLRI